MKNRNYILLICLIIGSTALKSCSESKTNDALHHETEIVFSDFNQFPNTPFLNLEFNSLLEDLKSELEDLNYVKQSDDIYRNMSDSTAIILNDEAKHDVFREVVDCKDYTKGVWIGLSDTVS